MGYIKHNAIIVTSGFKDQIKKALIKAKKLGLEVTNIVTSKINGYSSFLITPDGSKEGWENSDLGEERRKEWITWCNKNNEKEGGNFINYVHIRFGGDDEYTEILNSNHY